MKGKVFGWLVDSETRVCWVVVGREKLRVLLFLPPPSFPDTT